MELGEPVKWVFDALSVEKETELAGPPRSLFLWKVCLIYLGASDKVFERLLWSWRQLVFFFFFLSQTFHIVKNYTFKSWILLAKKKNTNFSPNAESWKNSYPQLKSKLVNHSYPRACNRHIYSNLLTPPQDDSFFLEKVWRLPLKDIFTTAYTHFCCLSKKETHLYNTMCYIGILITCMWWLFLVIQLNNTMQH